MAYLYPKKRSPFWYIQFVDADGRKRDKSTGLRIDDPNDTNKAKTMRAEMEAKEFRRTPVVDSEGWDTWVEKYLKRHCGGRTLERYLTSWKWISLWLLHRHLHSPRQITYKIGLEYLDWRTTFKKRTGKTASLNTAIMELKLFAMIMGEAVRLGHADANPLTSLKLQRDEAAEKPEMTDAEIITINEALKEEPEWMQVSFQIGLNTGCRLRETRIPLSCVSFKENKITFPAPKGGKKRAFSIPMPTALRELLMQLKTAGKTHTLEFPFQPSRRWQQFFIKLKMTHLTFHCLRVTLVNRLYRAGVPREDAMRLVNHSSALVHQIYRREKVEDVVKWRDAVQFPIANPSMAQAA